MAQQSVERMWLVFLPLLENSRSVGSSSLCLFLIAAVDIPIHLYCLYSELNPWFKSKWAGRDEVLQCRFFESPRFSGVWKP